MDSKTKRAIVEKTIAAVASEYVTQCVLSKSTPDMAAFCKGFCPEDKENAEVYQYRFAVNGEIQNWTVVDTRSAKFVKDVVFIMTYRMLYGSILQ